MTTSGAITSSLTALDIIKTAMELCNVLDGAGEPDATSAAMGLRHLNWLLKSLQADGCNLWRAKEYTATVSANVATVTLDPRVIDVLECRLVLSTTFERSLARWELGDYAPLPNKIAAGDPVAFYPDKRVGSVVLTFWMVPTVDRTVKYTAARVIEDVSALTQTLDVPQMWTECIYYMLADRLAKPFGLMAAAPALAADIKQQAQILYGQMRDADRPASVFMQRW